MKKERTQRKLGGLKDTLTEGGKLNRLMQYVLTDSQLSFEVRTKGEAKIYYKKCLALSICRSGEFSINPNYFLNDSDQVISTSEFDKIWKEQKKNIEENPSLYFSYIKVVINNWQGKKVRKQEFGVQQEIATANRYITSRYFIVDMEYKLAQNGIPIQQREKNVNIHDLVAIDRDDNSIVMFEVKYGLRSVEGGNSGANDHKLKFINEFEKCRNANVFRSQLYRDVNNIVEDKTDLGLIDFELPRNFTGVKFGVIHVYDDDSRQKQTDWYINNGIEEVIFLTTESFSLDQCK